MPIEEMPFVTVGIPVRNSAESIGYVIANLLSSDYPHDKFEIVIGNHASSDNTVGIVNKIAKLSPIAIRILDVPYTGPNRSANRNQIISKARGDIIIFIDDSILVAEDFIRSHVAQNMIHDDCLVLGSISALHSKTVLDKIDGVDYSNINKYLEIIKSSEDSIDSRENFLKHYIGKIFKIDRKDSPWYFCWGANFSAKKSIFELIENYDEKYVGWGVEDVDLGFKACQRQIDLYFSREIWGYHLNPSDDEVNNSVKLSDHKVNYNYFFSKYSTREIELLAFIGYPPLGEKYIKNRLGSRLPEDRYLAILDNLRGKLPKRVGTRIGVLMYSEGDSELLDLTHMLLPFGSWDKLPYKKNTTIHYSLYGFKLPFRKNEIDEAVIVLDNLLLFSEVCIASILLEVSRVVNKILLVVNGSSTRRQYLENKEKIIDIFPVERKNIIEIGY